MKIEFSLLFCTSDFDWEKNILSTFNSSARNKGSLLNTQNITSTYQWCVKQKYLYLWREVGSVILWKKLTFTLQSCPFKSVLQHISSVIPTLRSSVRGRTHRWCSARPSSLGGSRTCPPGRPRGRCSVGDSPSAHTLVLSSPPRTDTHRWCMSRGDHSPPRTPLS